MSSSDEPENSSGGSPQAEAELGVTSTKTASTSRKKRRHESEHSDDIRSRDTSTADESLPGAKRVKKETGGDGEPLALPGYRQSQKFWYPDGNVVIILGDVGFKLYASRLSHHFTTLPLPQPPQDGAEDGAADTPARCEIESRVTPEQFETLLKYLEFPFEYPIHDAPRDTVIELIHTSQSLGCTHALRQALVRLGALTQSEDPPPPDAHAYPDYRTAIEMISIARKHDVPSLLKPAFYELLRSTAFWDLVDREGRKAVSLRQGDLLRMLIARMELGKAWRALYRNPVWKQSKKDRRKCTCSVTGDSESASDSEEARVRRVQAWRAMFPEGVLDDPDPIMCAGQLRTRFVRDKTGWCDVCLEREESVWIAARRRWWRQLDGWLGLEPRTSD
ncbi:hypothetical protein OH77DRAFT_1593928 [Trametes cingulata]|nr:hypothetical protein OH77DRAFT_1593928 [Trametes cingulata]